MKLAVEVTTCTPERAGIGYYTEHIVDALIATCAPGDEVVLLGNRPLAPAIGLRWANRLHIGGAVLRYLWMQKDAPGMLTKLGADFAVFPNYLAPLGSPCPYLNVVHDLALLRTPEFFSARKRVMMAGLLPVVAQCATAVGTVSEASRRDVTELLCVPEHRVVMLPGAAHPACRPATAEEIARVRERYGLTRPYVLSVGTLEPRKNLPALLRALDMLLERTGTRSADLDLVAAGGRGWRDSEIRTEITRRLAGGRLRMLGYVPEPELVALYGGAEVLAYPSHFEGFGLPLLEAMTCGTPVVASDVAALHEVSGGAAILVPPGDDKALAAAIANVVENPAVAAAAKAAGLKRAATFRWETTAERLWSLARSALARTRGVTSRPRPRPVPVASPVQPEPKRVAPWSQAYAPPAGADVVDWAILLTTAYADMFDAAISIDELARTAIGVRLSAQDVRGRVLGPALARFLALEATGQVTLRGREALVPRGVQGARRVAELLDQNRGVIRALATLPFIRMLALSGGTAHRNARGGDDIDLFVVAAAGRVYSAYTMLFLASRLTGTRGLVCPNYIVDEDHLEIAYHLDLFTAHQAISLVPIAGIDSFERFVAANEPWVRPFYPGYRPRPPIGLPEFPRVRRTIERGIEVFGVNVERALCATWRMRMGTRAARSPRADVVLGGGVLKLHLSDHRRRVLARFDACAAEWRARWLTEPEDAAAPAPAPKSAEA